MGNEQWVVGLGVCNRPASLLAPRPTTHYSKPDLPLAEAELSPPLRV